MSDRTRVIMPNGDKVTIWADTEKNRVGYEIEGLPPTFMDKEQAKRQIAQMRKGAKGSPMSEKESETLSKVADAIETHRSQL